MTALTECTIFDDVSSDLQADRSTQEPGHDLCTSIAVELGLRKKISQYQKPRSYLDASPMLLYDRFVYVAS